MLTVPTEVEGGGGRGPQKGIIRFDTVREKPKEPHLQRLVLKIESFLL